MRGVSGLNQGSASLSCLLTRIVAAAETSAQVQPRRRWSGCRRGSNLRAVRSPLDKPLAAFQISDRSPGSIWQRSIWPFSAQLLSCEVCPAASASQPPHAAGREDGRKDRVMGFFDDQGTYTAVARRGGCRARGGPGGGLTPALLLPEGCCCLQQLLLSVPPPLARRRRWHGVREGKRWRRQGQQVSDLIEAGR